MRSCAPTRTFLDGLAFSANLLANKDLLHNPLALALERMRSRPSLRLKGTECIDPSGDVTPSHPRSSSLSSDGRTEIGVRVALRDIDGPATEILIFGEIHSSFTSSTSLTIRVARITPATRAPCPDNPIPRKTASPNSHQRELAANTRIKVNTNGKGDDSEVVRRAREVMLHLPNSKPRERGKEKEKERGGVFKVPAVPANTQRMQTSLDPGINLSVHPFSCAPSYLRIAFQIIEKFAVRHLDALGAPKSHPEFKELFGFVYRGTVFALVRDYFSFSMVANLFREPR
ncbi:hypothetical protein DFH29DRAFT_1006465 [Suillus ampliporus]|nr:hypothetical protein DFH29DRAFT_1006465 [Suillus ampliporus]